MFITPTLANTNASQAAIDTLVNALLLDMPKFSRLACTDGKFYGVETECDTCGNEYNECLRLHLIEGLITAHALTEKKLGYSITPQFITESQMWNGHERLITLRPGIAEFAVREKINPVSGESLYAVSPYLIEDAPLVDSESGYCIVQIDRDIVDNPNYIILRDANGAKVEPDDRFGFPRRTVDNWELALPSTQYPSPCDTGEINVQHCRYVSVVTDKKTVTSGEVFPVYQGTNQKIPQMKPSIEFDVDDDTFVRYWFYVWDMIDPAFFEEGMSWVNGEFYKLVENIELKNFTQEAAPITVTFRDACCLEETRYATVAFTDYRIVDAKRGVIELYRNGEPCSSCDCCLDACQDIVNVTYSYRTDPSFFFTDLGETLTHAMAYLVAAELPLKVCKCDTVNIVGFIQTAQLPYSKVTMNIYTGIEVTSPEIGDLYGEREYAAEINRLLHYRKVLIL